MECNLNCIFGWVAFQNGMRLGLEVFDSDFDFDLDSDLDTASAIRLKLKASIWVGSRDVCICYVCMAMELARKNS